MQPLIRLYDIPDNTFDANNEDDEDEEEEEEEEEEAVADEEGPMDTIVEEKASEVPA